MKFLTSLLASLDTLSERKMRDSARRLGRRSFLAKAGAVLVGTGLMPLLPFDRSMGKAFAATGAEDANSCDYWRYCALDGSLCSTSGGSMTSCPPGAEASKVAWVGTCRNPHDNKDYLVSYNDCCGKATVANATSCFTSQGERPGYRMGLHNDINWCMANTNKGYHCTVATLVGIANE
ncbi:methylamine dehydrogenase light chain (plasmid) [Chimaeribacter arupi]|uniref:Amine dehydrogenase n=2 Tax=Yersiniaceae TaxID=1903411 RepID=A0A2N5EMI0_9GAMM|nr:MULTISPECIES: methylamine dehydrogenase light chain [Yersiniaceae]MBS0968668.1 amine dehydrogenase [Nissabacter archeti]MDV5139711.1 methylamine dehydrogenase light chain [Chimaeribacter arupi]PLR29515.1 amine dehydrogenase [Chimaeribacter arupi]PLR49254.1 amine dehydrogenase [Chimaeribacter arupi]PLR52880.1 amine dehydrogenase [Chimaeribacter arupi]